MLDINWGVFSPSWVAIDVFSFNPEKSKGSTVYQAVLNICLDEGTTDENNMKHVTVVTDIVGISAGYVALKAIAHAESLFENIVTEISLWSPDGDIVKTVTMTEIESLFDIDDAMKGE